MSLIFDTTGLKPGILAILLSPTLVIRIRSNLKDGLERLTSEIQKDLHDWQHVATTYSLVNLTIIFRTKTTKDFADVQVHRLKYRSGIASNHSIQLVRLSQRIEKQLVTIFTSHPSIEMPFWCGEDWSGVGSPQHPIFDKMVDAGSSLEKWSEFNSNVCTFNPLYEERY
jgi:hypothetical protein